jgi:Trypsin
MVFFCFVVLAARWICINQCFGQAVSAHGETRFTSITSNIIGGQTVPRNSTIQLSYAMPTKERIFCAAILVWDDVLLSAGHCILAFNSSNQSVAIGGTLLDGSDAIDVDVPVLKVIVHPDFREATFENRIGNDVMLVFLNGQRAPIASFNADPSMPSDDAVTTVIGHGKEYLSLHFL